MSDAFRHGDCCDDCVSRRARLAAVEQALRETTQMLGYLWDASGLVDGFKVRDSFADGDPLHEDVPAVLARARALLEGSGASREAPSDVDSP